MLHLALQAAALPPNAPPPPPVHRAPRPFPTASTLSFLAGLLTPFTLSLGGLLPLGELVLGAVALWALLILALEHAWPGPLWRDRLFLWLLAAQAIALCAYVASDLIRGSAPPDMARGWARMIFLAADFAAIAYLCGCAARNLVILLVGIQLGEILAVLLHGPLFGDYWKFGFALPVTIGVLLLARRAGPPGAALAAAALGLLHFVLDFRSLGLVCLLVAAFLVVQAFSRPWRGWLAPLGLAAALAAGAVVYAHTTSDREGRRTDRSNVERGAMLQAAVEAFVDSPLVGHGSWFSRTDVMNNFRLIREERAREAGVGGFAAAHEEEHGVTLHSQLLVTLAEGGLFGAAFFIPFTVGLVWALHRQVVVLPWSPVAPLRLFLLGLGIFHVFFSPFSGAHRVQIALTAVLLVLIRQEGASSPPSPAPRTVFHS
jgi:hypothetical protein